MTLGQNLKDVRSEHDWSREQFAMFCDVSLETVEGVELGVFEPSINELYRFAAVLQCSTDRLLYGPPEHPLGATHSNQHQLSFC